MEVMGADELVTSDSGTIGERETLFAEQKNAHHVQCGTRPGHDGWNSHNSLPGFHFYGQRGNWCHLWRLRVVDVTKGRLPVKRVRERVCRHNWQMVYALSRFGSSV